jgi:histidyl-tRNA synthetase
MKAQMREANRQEARFVAILGEDEFGQGIVQLKNFETGEQEAVAFHDVVSTINKALLS